MAYTTYHVTKGAGADDPTNGGSMNTGNGQVYDIGGADGPCETYANVDATDLGGGVGYHSLDNNEANWGTTAVGDVICHDTAVNQEPCMVTAIVGSGVIEVYSFSGGLLSALGKNVNVGGAWATLQFAADTMDPSNANQFPSAPTSPGVNPLRVAVGPGTYTETVAIDFADGLFDNSMLFDGYFATPGDDAMDGASWSPPIIDGTTAAAHTVAISVDYVHLRNFILSKGNVAYWCLNVSSASNACFLERLKLNQASTTRAATLIDGGFHEIRDMWVPDAAEDGISFQGTGFVVDGLRVTDAVGVGLVLNTVDGLVMRNSIIDSPGSHCVTMHANDEQVAFFGCVFYNATGSGILLSTASDWWKISVVNCIFAKNSRYGIEGIDSDGVIVHADWNWYWDNTLGEVLYIENRGANETTLTTGSTGDPWNGAAGGDFTLNNVATGGALVRQLGSPGTSISGVVSYTDGGALQAVAAGGGGGVVDRGFNRGFA